MRLKSNTLSIILLISISVAFFGCETALKLKYRPLTDPANLLASVSPVRIKLLNFEDKREREAELILVGERQSRAYGKKYDVKSERPVSRVILEALKTELIQNGHNVVDNDETITIKGEIKTFWLETEVTPEQWDVIGEIQVLIEVVNSDTGSSTFLGPYSARNNEVRFLNPDNSILERVLSETLSKLIRQINSDAKFASALGKK